jgi:hypothetical protein
MAPGPVFFGRGLDPVTSRKGIPMCPHEIASTTHSLEMTQIQQINRHLANAGTGLRAQDLDLVGVAVHPDHVDTVAAHRAHLPAHLLSPSPAVERLAPDARLVQLVAAGSPTFPYIYGLFASHGLDTTDPATTGVRLLPVTLHTRQLRLISAHCHLHHRWGS